jgi:hypothetical protein
VPVLASSVQRQRHPSSRPRDRVGANSPYLWPIGDEDRHELPATEKPASYALAVNLYPSPAELRALSLLHDVDLKRASC